MKYLILVIITVIFTTVSANDGPNCIPNGAPNCAPNGPLLIDILYESVMDCDNYIIKQLLPIISKPNIHSNVDLNLLPFGKSQISKDNINTCPGGNDQCQANIIHNCVMKRLIGNSVAQVNFVSCTMCSKEQKTLEQSALDCSVDSGLNLDDVKKCSTSEEGNNLVLAAGKSTKFYPLCQDTVLPFVIYDLIYSEIDSDSSLKNFERTICKALNSYGYTGICTNDCKVINK